MNILYLIAVSLPIGFLFLRLHIYEQLISVISIFALTPLLQYIFGYTDFPSTFWLDSSTNIMVNNESGIVQHWFIDGWFPLFPWLGFLLFGVMLGNIRWEKKIYRFKRNIIHIIAISIIIVGANLWLYAPGDLLVRDGNSELFFFPATIGFIITAIGVTVLFFEYY